MNSQVQTRWLEHQFLSWGGSAVVNSKTDELEGIIVFAPEKTPLYDFFVSKEFQDQVLPIVRRTLMIIPDETPEEIEGLKEDLKKKKI